MLVAVPTATALATAPTLVAEAPTEVGYSSARGHGVIDPGSQEAFYRFEYVAGPLAAHDAAEGKDPFAGATSDGTGWLPAGVGATPVAPLLGEFGGLEPGVEYRLRLVAESEEGVAIALAPSFITPRPLEPIACLGDNCQSLPPEPRDPVLSTTVAGLGNPKVHYTRYGSRPKRHRRKQRHREHAARHKAGNDKGHSSKADG